jgi:ribonuclease P protein component
MLSKERRIKRKDFSNILSKGIRFNSPKFLLYVVKNEENTAKNKTKIAFSVSKKVYPRATDRNKYRRRGYASIQPVIEKIKPSHYLFFVFKKAGAGASFEAIESEVLKLLSEAHVLE